MKRHFRSLTLVMVLMVCLLMIAPVPVHAASFVVNNAMDGPLAHDINPGDGVCAIIFSGGCTLRAAIEESNAFPGVNTITFSKAMTIALSEGKSPTLNSALLRLTRVVSGILPKTSRV